MQDQQETGSGGADLHVFTAEDEEFVIAASSEDAAAVHRECVGEDLVFCESEGPVTWEQLPDDKSFTLNDEDEGRQTRTCGEWAKLRGRCYFATTNN